MLINSFCTYSEYSVFDHMKCEITFCGAVCVFDLSILCLRLSV